MSPSPRVYVRRRGFVHVPNATVHDNRISYAALGLLTVLLARPETAPQGYRDLMGRGLGQEATLTALRELTDAGYRHQVKHAGGRSRLITDTVVSEEPISRTEAATWLLERLGQRPLPVDNPSHRASGSRARTDLGKRNVSAGRIVPGVSGHDGPGPDGPPHVLLRSTQGVLPTEVTPENPTRACAHGRRPGVVCLQCPTTTTCEHGARRRDGCAICRHIDDHSRIAPFIAPEFDVAQLAAGEHLARDR